MTHHQRPRRPNLLVTAIGIVAVLAMLVVLSMLANAFDRFLTLWERAHALSPIAGWMLLGVLAMFLVGSLGLVVWLLRPAGKPMPRRSRDDLDSEFAAAEHAGIDVRAAQAELAQLDEPADARRLYLAVFGEISAGKSSLINALAPGAAARTDAAGGTTREVVRYDWVTQGGDPAILADVPGTGDTDADAQLAMDEARRAHLVLYVCTGDLGHSQWADLQALLAHGKPLIVVLNKQDRYASDALDMLRERIAERFPRAQRPPVVAASAGGREMIIQVGPDGTEREIQRDRPADVAALRQAIEDAITDDPAALATLRHHAIFELAADKLDLAQRQHRRGEAERIVARHTRAAVVGALAAISPGTDLVIQGVIGTRLVRELCILFDVRMRDVDTDALLKAAGSRARNNSALILAVAGNGLKAFPGVGTVTGGLAHAVAYGLLFDAFGRALVRTLVEQGSLDRSTALRHLDAVLDNDSLPRRARRIAALALDAKRRA